MALQLPSLPYEKMKAGWLPTTTQRKHLSEQMEQIKWVVDEENILGGAGLSTMPKTEAEGIYMMRMRQTVSR